jgi:NTP pyrophosphatase (non-canonical NTP hydrolase)
MENKRLSDLDDYAFTLHFNARHKGFYDAFDEMREEDKIVFHLKQLAMIHSEVAEVLEAMRKEQGDDKVVREVAGIMLSVMAVWAHLSLSGYTNYSLSEMINSKADGNKNRPNMHGVLA